MPMNKEYRNIAMLSTHGYFDPVPMLGQTDTGGQVVYVLELSKAMSTNEFRVDIFTRWFDAEKPQVEAVPGFPNVRVIRIPAGPWDFVTKEDIYEFLPELSKNMIAFIEKEKLEYSLFHGHYVDAGIVTLDLAAYFKCPSYFTAHSLGAWKREQMGGDPQEMEMKFNFNLRVQEETRILNEVSANSVTSSVQLEKLRELYAYEKDNTEVIPPGVNIHRFRPVEGSDRPPKANLPDKYIYCLSRIDSNKGHDMLLRAFHRVLQEVPDVKLVIGGGSPKPKPREQQVFEMMRKIIGELGMEGQVQFIGYVPEQFMVSYYQNAEMFVMPSLFEPFGMTTQEAMACGIPVIASKYGGIRTVIGNGISGILVDPKNEEEFSREMVKLLTDKEWREAIGRAGKDLIRTHYSWEVIAARHLAFYSDYSNLDLRV